ncbi:unnamed protein product [Clavelina lepadiformis]|uniref:Fe2OG dioxygenase domain-containing protein n=1 Tax=Clavelina lepadiformis TaxID=159417 RepID=A0ABP0H0B7_CLALP
MARRAYSVTGALRIIHKSACDIMFKSKQFAGIIPVVDYKLCGLDVSDQQVKREDLYNAGKELIDAFSAVGFVYLTNNGVDSSLWQEIRDVTDRFFNLEVALKERYTSKESMLGYIGLNKENLDKSKPEDFKEAFRMDGTVFKHPEKLPEDICPGIRNLILKFMTICRSIAERILDSLSMAMDFKEEDSLNKCHNLLQTEINSSLLRLNHYAPVDQNTLKLGSVRLGAHRDRGTVTLSFQDNVGGLQVEHNGKYVDVPPLQNAILLNAGDALHSISGGLIMSKKHRVVVPQEEVKQRLTRHSYGFFAYPDDDVMINPPSIQNDETSLNELPHSMTFKQLFTNWYSKTRVPN